MIWKYELKTTDVQEISMPVGAQLLCVQLQWCMPCLWALVDVNAPKEKREIRIYGTGNPLPLEPGWYVGTYQSLDGCLIWHVFDLGSEISGDR